MHVCVFVCMCVRVCGLLQVHYKCKGEKYLELVEGHATNTLHLGACQVYFFLPLTGGLTLPRNCHLIQAPPSGLGYNNSVAQISASMQSSYC